MGSRERLIDYIEAQRHRPFEIGVHDCLTFTNGAVKALHDKGFADDWLKGYINPKTKRMKGRKALQELGGHKTLYDALDVRLTRVDLPPVTGSVITTKHHMPSMLGAAMGIFLAGNGVFVGDDGLVSLPLAEIDAAWRVA